MFFFIQVSALDEDLGVNSQLTYNIQKGNIDGLLSITPGGMFQILRSLDREKESSYLVNIVAVDSGDSGQSKMRSLHKILFCFFKTPIFSSNFKHYVLCHVKDCHL